VEGDVGGGFGFSMTRPARKPLERRSQLRAALARSASRPSRGNVASWGPSAGRARQVGRRDAVRGEKDARFGLAQGDLPAARSAGLNLSHHPALNRNSSKEGTMRHAIMLLGAPILSFIWSVAALAQITTPAPAPAASQHLLVEDGTRTPGGGSLWWSSWSP